MISKTKSGEIYFGTFAGNSIGIDRWPLKIVCHAGNGCAGPVIDLLEAHLPFEFIKVDHEPDPTLPNGIPNPLLPEKRARASDAVRERGADLGLAWDGDFDRCFGSMWKRAATRSWSRAEAQKSRR